VLPNVLGVGGGATAPGPVKAKPVGANSDINDLKRRLEMFRLRSQANNSEQST
jgi:hypothetical protein